MPDGSEAEEAIGETPSSKLRNRIMKFVPDELRNKLREKNLPTTGDKDELVERLVRALSRSDEFNQILPEAKKQRISGYCVKWMGETGVVINEETGEEFIAHQDDVNSVDHHVLHALEPVEFSVDGDRAIRITKPDGVKV